MGILTAALLVEMKIDVTLIDINPSRLETARAFIPVIVFFPLCFQ